MTCAGLGRRRLAAKGGPGLGRVADAMYKQVAGQLAQLQLSDQATATTGGGSHSVAREQVTGYQEIASRRDY